jgi:hypothetical protein
VSVYVDDVAIDHPHHVGQDRTRLWRLEITGQALMKPNKWRCQPNVGRSEKELTRRSSGRQFTPLGQGGGAHLLEGVAAV